MATRKLALLLLVGTTLDVGTVSSQPGHDGLWAAADPPTLSDKPWTLPPRTFHASPTLREQLNPESGRHRGGPDGGLKGRPVVYVSHACKWAFVEVPLAGAHAVHLALDRLKARCGFGDLHVLPPLWTDTFGDNRTLVSEVWEPGATPVVSGALPPQVGRAVRAPPEGQAPEDPPEQEEGARPDGTTDPSEYLTFAFVTDPVQRVMDAYNMLRVGWRTDDPTRLCYAKEGDPRRDQLGHKVCMGMLEDTEGDEAVDQWAVRGRFLKFLAQLTRALQRGEALHWLFHPQLYFLHDDRGRPLHLSFVGLQDSDPHFHAGLEAIRARLGPEAPRQLIDRGHPSSGPEDPGMEPTATWRWRVSREQVDVTVTRAICRAYAQDYVALQLPVPEPCATMSQLSEQTYTRIKYDGRRKKHRQLPPRAQRPEMRDAAEWCTSEKYLIPAPRGLFTQQLESYSIALGLARALNRTLLLPGFWYSYGGMAHGKEQGYGNVKYRGFEFRGSQARGIHLSDDMRIKPVGDYFDLDAMSQAAGVKVMDLTVWRGFCAMDQDVVAQVLEGARGFAFPAVDVAAQRMWPLGRELLRRYGVETTTRAVQLSRKRQVALQRLAGEAETSAVHVHHLASLTDRQGYGPHAHPNCWVPTAYWELELQKYLHAQGLLDAALPRAWAPGALARPPPAGDSGFVALHWRRGDFMKRTDLNAPNAAVWQAEEDLARLAAEKLSQFRARTAYLATNEVRGKSGRLLGKVPVREYVQPYMRGEEAVPPGGQPSVRKDLEEFAVKRLLNPLEGAMMDLLIASSADVFIGNRYSTFSWVIHEQRFRRGMDAATSLAFNKDGTVGRLKPANYVPRFPWITKEKQKGDLRN